MTAEVIFERTMINDIYGFDRSNQTGLYYPIKMFADGARYLHKGKSGNQEYKFKSERGARAFIAKKQG